MENRLFGSGTHLFFIGMITFLACKNDDEQIPNASNEFAICNQIVGERCIGFSGAYCLFGFKWGEDSEFENAGVNLPGPKSPGGTVTFSFHGEGNLVSTHRQVNVPSQPFDQLPDCARDLIRQGLSDWSSHASICFQEEEPDSDTDLKFFVADISTNGVGFPNYPNSPCNMLAGHVILDPGFTADCDIFYLYALHEMGHALGLGHSDPENVMGASLQTTQITALQTGDIEGIQQIYGEK